MTRARAPLNLKLSREMKILLILLLMVALIGGWYVWTSTRNAAGLANSDGNGTAPVPIEGAPVTNTPDGTPSTGTVDPDGSAVPNGTVPNGTVSPQGTVNPDGTVSPEGNVSPEGSVTPDGTVTIPTLPPLGNPEGTLTGPNGEDPALATPTPGGINPDTALVLLPGVNPFRPLNVEAAAGTTPTGNVTANANPASGNGNTAPSIAGTPDTSGAADGGLDPLGTNGGALAISPIAGAGDTVPSDSVELQGGAFPLPTIPGADGGMTDGGGTETPVTDDGGVIITPGSPTITPDPIIADNANSGTNAGNGDTSPGNDGSNTGTPGSGNSASDNAGSGPASGTNDTDTPVVVTPLPPIKPPVAGVSVPSVNRVPSLTVGGNAVSNGANGTTGTGNATGTGEAGVTASLPTAAPRPGTPQVMTELAPISSGTAAETTRPLDQTIAARELAFNAVVLGPVNTAIFRSKAGFVVVSVGQTLPDSDIVIKEVTATSATLALGNDTQTLELDKR